MSEPEGVTVEEYRRVTTALTSEDDLQDWVLSEAVERGWIVFHLPNWVYRMIFGAMKRGIRRNLRWSMKGMPDTVCLRGPSDGQPARLLFLELKAEKGTTTKEQISVDGDPAAGEGR